MKYKQWECELQIGYYGNGNTAIQILDKEDYGLITTATVNLGDKLPENQAYIKDYSENEGMLEFLKKTGIVNKVIGYKSSGYIIAPLCELNMDVIKNNNQED